MTETKYDAPSTRKAFSEQRGEMARRSVAELIDLLSSDDLRTRFLAEMCLRDAAGT